MTQPPESGDWYYRFYQRELDRRFTDLQNNLELRFTNLDREIKEIKVDVKSLEEAPKDTFRAYATPIIVSIITAVILAFLVAKGVTVQ